MTRFHLYAALSLILLPIAAQTKDAWPWRKPVATCYQQSPEGWPLVGKVLTVPDGQPSLHCVYRPTNRSM